MISETWRGPAGTISDMDPVEDDEQTARPVRRLLAPAILAFSALVVLGTPLFDERRVGSASDQARVGLGRPLAWLHQDQTAIDPPLPAKAGLASPWEHPTGFSFVPFVADVVLVFAAVAALVLILAAATRASRTSRRAPDGHRTH
jgi:hypothetical protein